MARTPSAERKSITPAIRSARAKDLGAIREIYNDAVLRSTATFDTRPRSVAEQRRWYAKHGRAHPVLVAVLGGRVIGWASLSPWSERRAYSETAEVSFYVESPSRGHGVGKKLLRAIVREGRRAGLHALVSRITAESLVSIHLHEELGFEHVGVMREVGRKFGRRLDVCLMQKTFS